VAWPRLGGTLEGMTEQHRLHLDRKPVQGGQVTQSWCDCGWSGTWLHSQARAAEDGRGHLLTAQLLV